MYDFKYVKKRKTRIWVAIGGGISTIVVATLSIVSFLGRFVGTFTVRLETGTVALTLCEKQDFEEPSTYLRVAQLPTFQECTYATLVEHVGDAELDNENSGYLHGATYYRDGVTIKALNYFKYTFFVKNVGQVPAGYQLTINIVDSKSDNGKTVEDTLRVMVYDNKGASSEHNKTVYAKRNTRTTEGVQDEHGNYLERISTDDYGYAAVFEDDTTITTLHQDYFEIGEVQRYTLVIWLEGFDPESDRNYDPPKNARLKLGVEINAYEI